MINLIPNEEKKNKVKDFYLRFSVLFFIILGCSFLSACALLFPSYFLSFVKKDLVSEKLTIQKATPIPEVSKSSSLAISSLNKRLKLIENIEKNKYIVSMQVINEILSKKMPDIKINKISYKNDPTLGKTISIGGVASSRERLLFFRNTLEGDAAFQKVDLPISNFVKGSDISFSLDVIPAI